MKNVKILIIDKFDENLLRKYNKFFNLTYDPKMSINDLLECIHKFKILIISTRIPITKELINKADNLKLIVRMGTGVDHIDLNKCKKHNITVCNTPNSNISPVVEYVFAQIIDTYRNFNCMSKNIYEGNFRNGILRGEELKSKKLGIIGVGRIGSRIAKVAKAFDMQTLGYDPYLSKTKKNKLKIDKWMKLKKLIKISDIISLHVPLTKKTEYLVNKDFLRNIKKDSILINTSRGKVINYNDLFKFAKKGILKKIILDVYEKEPFTPDSHPIIEKYFFFTPHTGAYTKESLYNRSMEAMEEIEEFINNRKPHGKINFIKGY